MCDTICSRGHYTMRTKCTTSLLAMYQGSCTATQVFWFLCISVGVDAVCKQQPWLSCRIADNNILCSHTQDIFNKWELFLGHRLWTVAYIWFISVSIFFEINRVIYYVGGIALWYVLTHRCMEPSALSQLTQSSSHLPPRAILRERCIVGDNRFPRAAIAWSAI